MPQSTAKIKIPDISLAKNGHHLIWLLLGEIEKNANYKVLFGKKDLQEVFFSLYVYHELTIPQEHKWRVQNHHA